MYINVICIQYHEYRLQNPRLLTFAISMAIIFAIGLLIGTLDHHQVDATRLIATTGGPGQSGQNCCVYV